MNRIRANKDVLILAWRDTQHPEGGGSEKYVEKVAEHLAAHGHNVTIRTARYTGSARRSTHNGVTYLRAGGRKTVYPRALIGLMLHRKPDIIIDVHNGIPFFARLITRTPVIILTHHCHKEQWPVAGKILGSFGWWLESWLSPRVHANNQWVTVSQPSADELTRLGINNITIIRNGCDPTPQPALTVEATHTHHLICVSRLVPHKQLEHALNVVARLKGEDVMLDIVGSGWWEEHLRAQVDALGIGEHVTFHGHVGEQLKHALLDRASIHLMPSRKEGWGITVMEAAQHAVPTIGYASSQGLKDSIDNHHTGILVEGEDELYATTRALLKDPVTRRRLGQAARAKAATLSWEATGQAWEKLLTATHTAHRHSPTPPPPNTGATH